MHWIKGFAIAFSTYSAIPMPQVEWSEKNRRYALCFFPLIGVVSGLCLWLVYGIGREWGLANELVAALMTLAPLGVSGGIHMDGLMDTWDALAAHRDRETRLRILKDTHTGAFGVMGCLGYLLLMYGCWMQLLAAPAYLIPAVTGQIASRSWSGLGVATIRPARSTGMLNAVSGEGSRWPVTVSSLLGLAVCGACWLCFSLSLGLAMILAGLLGYVGFRLFCFWFFGGNTGDLSGWYQQTMELVYVMLAAIGGAMGSV